MSASEGLTLCSRDDLLRVITAQQQQLTAQERQRAELTATVAALRAEGGPLSGEALHRIDTAEK
jgi:cell division protein FtsB